MVIRGRVKNGVIVVEDGLTLPEGAEVTVVVRAAPEATKNVTPEERRRRLIDAFQRIASLPIEGSTEPFSGADHDKVLYGNP